MCWACEEQDMWYRYRLEVAVVRGAIPEGFVAADFEAYGLPVPGSPEAAALLAEHPAAVEAMRAAEADSARPVASDATPVSTRAAAKITAKPAARPSNPFVCEPADRE
jgi:hypothetical protein